MSNITKIKGTIYYDKIVNFVYEENDLISSKLIEFYQEYIFTIKNKQSKLAIDKIMNEYTNKENFYKYVILNLQEDIFNTYDQVIVKLKKLHREFELEKLNNIKEARWI